ncbi:MAG: aminotransferase class III-fold pyridoxal phosphate-dependent enzyme, partial [Proteobacteria bacterium]|nr:aminotransferase class III-fold pyridoxal phosphate-dependent enzyme [Pseudomonadota bacterium]
TTGYTGVVCTSATYHGNTTAVSQLSATRPPLGGRGQHICQVSPPNELEPIGADAGLSQAQAFARQVSDAVLELQKRKCGLSALILCPLFANEGFPTLERGFLDETVSIVRANGGVIIADEVQCGFGRTGNHYWGHEKLGFVPDIITLGKPIANGYPVGAVVTRADYLALFQENYRYFNTFGGNPVACAAANATLDVLVEEELKENARVVGAYALEQLHQIKANHPIVASVRGAGLFFGAELDRQLVPNIDAKDIAAAVSETMKDAGVLTGISGWHRTILKMRPPLPYARDHVDMLIDTLDKALSQVMSSLDKNGSRAAKPIRQKTDSAPRKTRAPKDKSAPIGKTTTKNEMKSSQQVKAVDETANKTTSRSKATVDVTATRRQAAAKGEVSTKDGVASRRKASVDVVADKVGVASRRKAAVKGKVSTKVGVASRRKAATKGEVSTKVSVASRRKAAVKGVASTKDGVASRRKAAAQGGVSTKVSVASRRKAAAKGVASTKDGVASRRKAAAVDEAATKDGLKRKRKTPYISKAMARRQAAILDDMAPQNRAF